jgi:soluble lytic murein transglycosylase-like protein
MKKTPLSSISVFSVVALNVSFVILLSINMSDRDASDNASIGQIDRPINIEDGNASDGSVRDQIEQPSVPVQAAPKEKQATPDPIQEIAQNIHASFGINTTRADNFAAWVYQAHLETEVPVGYMIALVATESSFRYKAVSHAGAVGPAQVVPRFWEKWCDADLKDPRENIICGAKVLAHYRSQCEDWSCAFKKYNVGPTGYKQAEFISAMRRYITKIDRNIELAGGFEFLHQG